MNARELPRGAHRWRGGLTALVGAWLSACASHPPSPPPVPPSVPTAESANAAVAPTSAPEVAPPPSVLQPPSAAPCAAPPPATTASTHPVQRRKRPVRQPPANEELPQPQASRSAQPPPRGTEIKSQVGEIGSSVTSILGKRVEGPSGEDLGRVVDVLADASGRVRVAIIDFGGFLGVGSRRIAVDWPLLRFDVDPGKSSLILSVSREKLQAAPEYKDAERPRVLLPASVAASSGSPETKK